MDHAASARSQIVWPVEPALKDAALWKRNVLVVNALCDLGTVTKWLDGVEGKDTYLHIAYRYEIDGIDVEFLPHWGFITVGGYHTDVPETKNQLRNLIRKAKASIHNGKLVSTNAYPSGKGLSGYRMTVKCCPFCSKKHVHHTKFSQGDELKREAGCRRGVYSLIIVGGWD